MESLADRDDQTISQGPGPRMVADMLCHTPSLRPILRQCLVFVDDLKLCQIGFSQHHLMPIDDADQELDLNRRDDCIGILAFDQCPGPVPGVLRALFRVGLKTAEVHDKDVGIKNAAMHRLADVLNGLRDVQLTEQFVPSFTHVTQDRGHLASIDAAGRRASDLHVDAFRHLGKFAPIEGIQVRVRTHSQLLGEPCKALPDRRPVLD